MRGQGRVCLVFWMLLVCACAERLPIRQYTMADGLPDDRIACIVADSQGFLWFCTGDGLARFDGGTFTNFGTEQGLPNRKVIDFLETRDGEYWAATATGLSRLKTERAAAAGSSLFEDYAYPREPLSQRPVRILEAADGDLWYLAEHSLFRFHRKKKTFERVDGPDPRWTTFFRDADDSLWLGSRQGIFHRLSDGRFVHYEGFRKEMELVTSILRDRKGRLWAGTWRGLCLLNEHTPMNPVLRIFKESDGLANQEITSLFEGRDGTLWTGSNGGLNQSIGGAEGEPQRFRSFTPKNGLYLGDEVGRPAVSVFSEDSAGNLWFTATGPVRLARSGFTTFTVEDGLAGNRIGSIREDHDGRLIVMEGGYRSRYLHFFRNGRWVPILPRVPEWIDLFTWGGTQIHMQDHIGTWWVATARGLCRYPRGKKVEDLAHTMPERVYLRGEDIFRLYEDRNGDMWVSVIGPDQVTVLSRRDDRIRTYTKGENGRLLGTPICFEEDAAGGLWMGFYWHDVARYAGGRFQVFTASDGLPAGRVTGLFRDHTGRIWMATNSGLIRVDRPAAERPQFRLYTTASGLSYNEIMSITEDNWGRLYIGTRRGLDRLDPETDHIRHFTEADGIPWAGTAYRDRSGVLWFGSIGLKRLAPQPTVNSPAPPIRITGMTARGKKLPGAPLGAGEINGVRLSGGDMPLEIEFASMNFEPGQNIHFQYRLSGRDWGPVAGSARVTFGELAPGTYRFEVRAVSGDGVSSKQPAFVEMTILPPWWRSIWFAGPAMLFVLAAIWYLHQYRLRQVLELERMRTRIATDLHDDIGSSLTQIAILSEVAQRQIETDATQVGAPLSRIADLSRELVDSMSDIVWAINPQRDHVSDLAHRMRRFASDVFPARNIAFEFQMSDGLADLALQAEARRHLYLVFKECANNILRHSGCRRAEFRLNADGEKLVLWMRDDGHGLAPLHASQGNGLPSMESRIRSLGGELRVCSQPGTGTAVSVSIPLTGKNRGSESCTNR